MEVRDYLWQILSAIEYLHAHNILHLDLRSENIIITEPNLLKLLDFGNAQFYTQDKVIILDKCMDYVETMGEYRDQSQQPWPCTSSVVNRKTDRATGQGSSWPQHAKSPRCYPPVTVRLQQQVVVTATYRPQMTEAEDMDNTSLPGIYLSRA